MVSKTVLLPSKYYEPKKLLVEVESGEYRWQQGGTTCLVALSEAR